MTTIAIDRDTKIRAGKRAKRDKLPLSTVARFLLEDYASGKISIGTQFLSLRDENGFTPSQVEEILWIRDNDKSSEVFGSAEEFLADLKT